jgi:hypothetical protein
MAIDAGAVLCRPLALRLVEDPALQRRAFGAHLAKTCRDDDGAGDAGVATLADERHVAVPLVIPNLPG